MRKKYSRKPVHKRGRIPIAAHIYCSLLLISLFVILVLAISIHFILNIYVKNESARRIDSAVVSCQNFAKAFRSSLPFNDDMPVSNEDEIKNYLLSSIASYTDLSNEASIILFSKDYSTDERTLIWPNADYSKSLYDSNINILDKLLSDENFNYDTNENTNSIDINGDTIYFRLLDIEYSASASDETIDFDRYYMLIYINTASYYSFYNAINMAILHSMVLSIIASSILSLVVTLPIVFSTRRLALFANRIGHGDFTPLKGKILSKELSDLSEVMNTMAVKLAKNDLEQKTFFQNASHELRTPLMSIQGYAEGIKYDVFDTEGKYEAVDVIIDESSRLSGLVENLLSISKMDMSKTGSYEIKKTNIDVRELSEAVIGKVRGSFLLSEKELINDISTREAFIYGNENDLIRMLENIISNGLRYCKKSVKFSCKEINGYAVFEIEDDGDGISDEVFSHLFDRFAKGSDGKHGIGLSLSKAIAEEHEGKIEAKNIENSGACFTIKIPIVKPKEQLTNINNN